MLRAFKRLGETVGFVVVSLAVAATSARGDEEVVYVSNEVSGDIAVLSATTGDVLDRIAVGKRPRGIHLSADGQWLFVAVSGSPRLGPGADPERAKHVQADKAADGIQIVDTATRKVVRRLFVGSDPEEFALTPDGARIIVSNEDVGEASCWDVSTGKLVWRTQLGEEPEGVTMHPNGREVYVACEGSGEVWVLTLSGGEVLQRIQVGQRPRVVAFENKSGVGFVSLETDGSVAVLSGTGREVSKKIEIRPAPALPMGIVFAPDGQHAAVATGRGGGVALIDVGKARVEAVVRVGKRPWGVAYSRDGKTIFAANGSSNDVSMIDAAEAREVRRVTTGEGPWGVAVGRIQSRKNEASGRTE